jgi:hypothetical protein
VLFAFALQNRITSLLPSENLYKTIDETKRVVSAMSLIPQPQRFAITRVVPLRSITKGSFD